MTNAELNRDIRRLARRVETLQNTEKIFEYLDEVKAELSRLYYADDEFTAMNKQSVLILLRLNLRFRVIPLHLFGINVEIFS